MKAEVKKTIEKYGNDKFRLMDILIDIQKENGYIPGEAITQIAEDFEMSEVDVEQTVSFYHFFSQKPTGKYAIFLNNSVVANMMGRAEVAATFMKELGIKFGEVTPDGSAGLFNTSCIGMNDQEPAAIINNRIFTRLTPFRVKEIVRDIREGKDVDEMNVQDWGDGENSSDLIRSVVSNNIRKIGPVLDRDFTAGQAIEKIIKLKPEEVIEEVKKSNMRGRGGAGFPTGLKWEFCRNAPGEKKYIFCNADEGEPGTFKDRVILTERPRLLFEGMVIAGYAVGASEGIVYVRYEYKYLEQHLEKILQQAREANYLGKNILGKKGFNFDIRIQFGAGAYVCGEESALIESAEGKRGEPRDRPPFPVEKGYHDMPTVVNNVETLCSVVKVILKGGEWYKSFGTNESTGTKLLSISGDCKFPGVYEVVWGFSVNDILDMVGAGKEDVQAVQVGGPSGALISPDEFNRTLGYEDLATGGSLIIIGKNRDILSGIVLNFMDFFIDESCGSCSTCRIVPTLMRNKLNKILNARGTQQDIDDLTEWGKILKASRCGLGQTAGNPILSSLKNFPALYEEKIQKNKSFDSGFDLNAAIKESAKATGRIPNF
ncbi:MAG: NAD(P)H-dependent oxidoreductase subunit E [Bacteroidales bacterium]|nr:NAD(P)H-dependent oxidoreductase subunit E [Bacteroidales bacterium]MBN2764622.1 NAD(P)H-dependent oxidoreductase subunit E [Bacteroidales bacterium]